MTAEQSLVAMPEVSVLIPVFGRAAQLERCLSALACQTLARDRFEVIVCDDGSPEPIATTLAAAIADLADRVNLRVIRQDNAGPASARNRAAAAARGRYLAFTDDDCRPEPNWLEQLLARFTTHADQLLGGGMRTSRSSDPYAHATQAIMDFVYGEQERRGGLRLFSTSNLALPACAFRELGGFSTSFRQAAGEDYDLCARWHLNGGEVIYVPSAIVVHDHALTLAAYWSQHFRYGRGLLQMRRRLRARGGRIRPGALPGTFHARLVVSPLSNSGMHGIRTALLIVLSQIATAAGMLSELTRAFGRKPAATELLQAPSQATKPG